MKYLRWALAYLLSVAAALLLGVVLGSSSWLEVLVRLSFWFVVPVGAAAFGVVVALIMYWVVRKLNAPVGGATALMLGLAGGVAFWAMDAGVWLTSSVELRGHDVPVRHAMTFLEFEAHRFSGSLLRIKTHTREMGHTATVVAFAIKAIAATVVTGVVVWGLCALDTYCGRCGRYRQRHASIARDLPSDPVASGAIVASLRALVAARSYGPLAHLLVTLPPLDDASTHKLKIRENVCGTCRSGAIDVSLSRRTEKGWKANSDFSISSDSGPGEAPGIAVDT